ncbi:hypothetical protein ACVII1_003990 [Bradyrhizobium elkanii]
MTAFRILLQRAFVMLAAAGLAVPLIAPANAAGQGASPDAAALGRGINILGYDGIWEGYHNAPFRPENLAAIRRAGFSHVRINFFGFRHMDSGNILDDAVLRRLDAVIEQVLASRLVPILDEHDTDLCQRDVAECGVKLKAFWRQIASRYAGKYPALVFEILNEPGGNMTSAEWNELLGDCLAIIRGTNPKRNVVVAILNTRGAADRSAGAAGRRPKPDRHIPLLPAAAIHPSGRAVVADLLEDRSIALGLCGRLGQGLGRFRQDPILVREREAPDLSWRVRCL